MGGGVVGAGVVGAGVVGAGVVGAGVVGAGVVGAGVGDGVGDAVGAGVVGVGVGEPLVVAGTATGVVDVDCGFLPVPGVAGPEDGPGLPVGTTGGLSRTLRNGGSPPGAPGSFGNGTTALGLARAAFGDCEGDAEGAGQATGPQATNPLVATVDRDAPPAPYQQMIAMMPSTPVPITILRTERGCRKSSCPGTRCRFNDFPPLAIAVSYCLEVISVA